MTHSIKTQGHGEQSRTMKKKTVFVGLSGGVDSAVSAALLKKQGFEVVGVFIKTWHPDFLECNEEEERHDAMCVAAHLGIPFLTFDFENVYKKEVADYMIREYKAGRTPNPDVMCNKEVKFGAFLKKALAMGALVRPSAEIFVATGHYARTGAEHAFLKEWQSEAKNRATEKKHVPLSSKILNLLRGSDPSKDQSYFLWTLRQEQLKKILFPISNLKKIEVRRLAKKFKLPVAEKKDSQGICFLGAVDLKEFLKHYIKEKKGKIKNEAGEIIGYHDGAVFHTLGERHGFTITKKSPKDGPYYIVGKDVKKNILVVSQMKKDSKNSLALLRPTGRTFRQQNSLNLFFVGIKDTNWIFKIPKSGKNYTAQIRYHGEFLPCTIKCAKFDFAQVVFKKPVLAAAGQSCVIYDGDVCLGGGVII
ncbi:MAG: tRNA-specific 2-thiouridylase MnmA [Candidatus Nomurabacteria bacterium GW2011_GWF2_43_8]|uniref:tRNA-specific 2-thiouridylase MnmA n=2 Tax=Candidatus Nomuraibacteriota TaxID=1752729 RepID=A0A0G1FRP4_9BACT|nr:MAG: tRNA-specific 2-thiouridylase MnmA [Candidatus Nomurabacteria bacterium GW2011_GWA2_43_15]KKT25065.1 MAG: tRNA-specific 2-thiouridylase MnmA [Candidatus Nomurabacteria bacterium GW2011_GWF2_43_8]